jgi:hypothetical protein
MHPISSIKKMARFGALFAIMRVVAACASPSSDEHPKKSSQALCDSGVCSDEGSVIYVSTSAPAWPSTPPGDPGGPYPSASTNPGGGGDPGDPGCTNGFYVNGVCRHIGDPCNANRAGAANCDCQARLEGSLATCRYGADTSNNPMIVYTCRGTSTNPGGAHHGEADDDPTTQRCP